MKIAFACLAAALLGVIVVSIVFKNLLARQAVAPVHSTTVASGQTSGETQPPAPVVSQFLLDSQRGAPATSNSATTSAKPLEAAPPAAAEQPKKPAGKSKDPLTDPLARVALTLVGADLDAEMYWVGAINDPSLPAGERKDLIEDLNEEGFVDPKHPSADDLPLIMSRIALIEELWPFAMDENNWEAFDEAYKDLLNLGDIALGAGHPPN